MKLSNKQVISISLWPGTPRPHEALKHQQASTVSRPPPAGTTPESASDQRTVSLALRQQRRGQWWRWWYEPRHQRRPYAVAELSACLCQRQITLLNYSTLTFWHDHCCHMGTAMEHPVPDRVKPSFLIFDIQSLTLKAECQSAWMSKITNDGLTRSGMNAI